MLAIRYCCFRIHRMVEVGRILWGSSSSIPSQAGSARAGCLGLHPAVFEYIRKGLSLQNISWWPGPWFDHSHKVKKMGLCSTWNFMCFNVCPLPLFPDVGHCQSLVPSFSFTPIQYLYTWTGSIWASSSLGWTPKVLLCRAAFQSVSPQPVLEPGIIKAQVQEFALSFVEPHEVFLFSFFLPAKAVLESSVLMWCISHSSQFCVVNLLRVHSCPFTQVIKESIRRYWSQYWSPDYTTSVLPPAGLHATLSAWPFLFSIHLTVHWYNLYILSLSVRALETVTRDLLKLKLQSVSRNCQKNGC